MSYAQQLHALLEQTSAPDTALIQQATAQLNTQFYKSPECIPALYEIVATSPQSNIRQLAAVELRKRVASKDGAMWKKVPVEVRNQIKENVLQAVLKEQTAAVSHSTSRVISAIASIELEIDPPQWPELLPFLYSLSASPTASHREIGMFILYALLDTVAECLQTELGTMFGIFRAGLVDPESEEVRITTLRALGKVAEYIELDDKNDIAVFQALIPSMVAVLHQAMSSGNDDGARKGFDVFETLLILETPLISKAIADLVNFFLTGGETKEFEPEIRCMSLNALLWTIRYKSKKVQQLNLGDAILGRLLPIGREEDPEDHDEDSPSRLAFRVLDVLSQTLPPTQIFPALHRHIQTDMASADPSARKAALMALGVTVEGCSEFIRPHVAQLWPVIEAGLQDSDPIVKKAACIALGCLCEWLPEECAARHEVIVPVLFNHVSDPLTQKSACAALDSYLEILGDKITNYLPLLMERLIVLLDSAPLPVRATVTGAIGSAAHASKEGFIPYFGATIGLMQNFLTLKEEGEETELRGIATDTLGTIAEAVGKEVFRPYFQPLVKLAFEGLLLENPRLRECSYIFFATMAKVFEDEFAPYLPNVMEALISSCEQSEQDDLVGENGDINATVASAIESFNAASSSSKSNAGDISVGDEDEGEYLDIEDDAEELEKLFGGVNSGIAIEKEVAADSIGDIFASTGSAFLPYVERSVKVLVGMLDHYYEGIRKSALGSLFKFISTFYDLSEPAEWTAGIPVTVPLHNNVKQLVDVVLPAIFQMWDTEDDRTVVIMAANELAEAMNKCGPALVDGYFEKIAEYASDILQQRSLCQQDPDEDEAEVAEEGDSSEYESALISNACDVVGALASVLGPDFAAPFGQFLPLIRKFYSDKRSSSDRSMAVGSLGEIITGLKGSVTPYAQPLFELIYLGLSDNEPEVRSNAAFAAGVLIENMDAQLGFDDVVKLLTVLRPFFGQPEPMAPAVGAAKDNASGAVARIILKDSNVVPLDQVLPILFEAMPLKNDFVENRVVFRCIFELFQKSASDPKILPALMAHIDRLLAVFHYVLEPSRDDETTQDTRDQLIALIRHLSSLDASLPPKIQAAGLSSYL